jgi:hypothetical protein
MQQYVKDTAQLSAGVLVHLIKTRPSALNGRWISCNWDIKELEDMKEKIVSEGLLRHSLLGLPGLDWGVGGR